MNNLKEKGSKEKPGVRQKQKCRQKYTSTKVHLRKDNNNVESEILHPFPSPLCSPGDLAAKGEEKGKGEISAEALSFFFRWVSDEMMGK